MSAPLIERKKQRNTDDWQVGKHIKVREHTVPDCDFCQVYGWVLESKVVFGDVWLGLFSLSCDLCTGRVILTIYVPA